MRPEDLTPEQQKAMIEAGATLTKAAADIITAMTNAIKPIMDWYNSLPPEIQQMIAASQVAQEHPTLFPSKPIDTPERDQWIMMRIQKDYSQYWNEEQQVYVITEMINKEEVEVWKPTRDELVEDISRAYDEEFGS